MVAIVLTAIVTCAAAPILGQAILRLCGFDRWSPLAVPVGLATMILVALLALDLPGRVTTTAVLLVALVLTAAVVVLRDRALRPPLGDVLAVAPVAALALVPFATAGRAGTLGVSFNNDMSSHLLWAESVHSAAAAAVYAVPTNYPMGPHALAATLAQGLGIDVAHAFAGVTVAAAMLLAWTALGMLGPRVRWPGRAVAATVAGMPFLVAAYYGQGSFKELMQALFVLGVAVALVDAPERRGRLRWAPVAVIAAGAVAVYSILALSWIVGVLGAVAGVAALRRLAGGSRRALLAGVRAQAVPVAVAAVVLAVVIAPQVPEIADFVAWSGSNGTPIRKDDIGNLVAPLPVWEALAVWGSGDYRLPAADQLAAGLWTAFVLALVVLGVLWSLRRREWVLPLAVLVALAIWAVSNRTQSPYVAAKALVMLAPLLALLAVRPLVERDPTLPRAWRLAAPLLALVLVVAVAASSLRALRFASVGTDAQTAELRSLRPLLHGKPTLFLGNDDYIRSKLAGVPIGAAVLGVRKLPPNPPKLWSNGQALDVDSVTPEAINAHDWVIATRDAAASEMPPQLELAKLTRGYALWRRTGVVAPRAVLAEGDGGAATLDCASPEGRRIARGGGVARVRPAPSAVAVAPFAAGTSIGVDLPLEPGTYDLVTPYLSSQPIDLQVVGHLETVLPANLGRPGPRWPIGRVTIPDGRRQVVRIGMYARRTRLTPASAGAQPGAVLAVPVGGRRTVPIRRACGKLVDWYLPAEPE